MWIKFGYSTGGSFTEWWEWVSEQETDDSLKEMAREYVPDYVRYECDYYRSYFQRGEPSLKDLLKLQEKYQAEFDSAKFLLNEINQALKAIKK